MSRIIKHEGELDLMTGVKIPCYVLEDGTRVLSGRAMQEAMKIREKPEEGGKRGGYILPTFFASKALKPFVEKKLEVANLEPIICKRGNQTIHGYEATVLADLCDAVLEARKNGEKLTERQEIVATQCEILIRSFAKVGIIALVDEATGYQYEREKNELQVILKAYISKELIEWQKRFPDLFYQEIFRLNKWDFTVSNIKKRPGVVGTWTNKLVYEQLPKGVLEELKKATPKTRTGKYKARFHQSLTEDIGHPDLQSQIFRVIGIMNISDSWKDFVRNFNKMLARKSGQLELQFEDLEPPKEIKPAKQPAFDMMLTGLLKVPPPRGNQ